MIEKKEKIGREETKGGGKETVSLTPEPMGKLLTPFLPRPLSPPGLEQTESHKVENE